VVQEVGAAAETQNNVRQLEGEVGGLAELARCREETHTGYTLYILYIHYIDILYTIDTTYRERWADWLSWQRCREETHTGYTLYTLYKLHIYIYTMVWGNTRF
jgi:hypothetical protein